MARDGKKIEIKGKIDKAKRVRELARERVGQPPAPKIIKPREEKPPRYKRTLREMLGGSASHE